MVQALLSSIKTSLGVQASQNKEFKVEAIKNNRNVSNALKDVYKMVSSSRRAESRNAVSLNSIETSTAATSEKVDRSNALLQESISLQTQMVSELRGLAKSFSSLLSNNNNTIINQNQQQNTAGGMGTLAALATLGTMAGIGAVGMGAIASQSFFGNKDAQSYSGVGSSENAEKALSFFKEKGWTPEQAAGIVGNLQAESSQDLNPSAVGDGGKAYGIAQWHPDRQANFENQFGKTIRQATFEDQLKFIQWELENTEKKAGNLLKSATSAAEAAAIIDQHYERSSGEHRGRRIANANRLIEGDETGGTSTALGPQSTPTGSSGGNVDEQQSKLAGIRKLPLSPKLKSVLQQAAAAAGVDVVVYSGGQARAGEGGPRTGSTRHDHGNAADLNLYRNGKMLSDVNEGDRALMAKFVSAAIAAGATGVGAGHSYMGPSSIHVGFGKPAVWGGASWIKDAASGVYNNRDLQAENTDLTGGYASSGGGGSGILDSLGMLTGLDMGGLSGMLSSFFGIPLDFGSMSNAPTVVADSSNNFSENLEKEPDEMMGRSAGVGGPMVGNKEYDAYVKSIKEKDFMNYEYDNMASKIQTSALKNNNMIVVNTQKPMQQSATMPEIRADFGAVAGSNTKETRATWAPRIAVLRPDDDVTRPLTWAARIKGYA